MKTIVSKRHNDNYSIVLRMVIGGVLAVLFLCLVAGGLKLYVDRPIQNWVKGEFLFLSFCLVSSPIGWITFAMGSLIALFLSGKQSVNKLRKSEEK